MKTLFVILIMAAIIVSLWAHFAAPCEYYKYFPGKDIPGRCLMLNR